MTLYLYGKKIPQNKQVVIALSTIFGLGYSRTKVICNFFGFGVQSKLHSFNNNQKEQILNFLKKYYLLDIELKDVEIHYLNILLKVKNYKSFKFKNNLPVNGQRTRTNARTARKRKLQRRLL